ncbi:hypothetical protein [Ferroacidibacillus organovorans]|uniref:Uncharacterized protein n=1 Tax=Ferroacidibacillus organovorans TaxID=1765683 RepID=A0A853KB72_9BACL|nr:hypothetical protein [Ferroacidibacillus organovorans]KYP79232.1 hypothetical protein AYJ22_15330 [Ferroacidibacillus organovorans]OAG86829.1 hypothetical protein AYW79_14815 [Ferroacidibacillus organovorans]
MKPLDTSMLDLERSIKRAVLAAHKQSTSGTWANVRQRLESPTTLSVYCDGSVIAGQFHLGVLLEPFKPFGIAGVKNICLSVRRFSACRMQIEN